jgi:hypothetical protein
MAAKKGASFLSTSEMWAMLRETDYLTSQDSDLHIKAKEYKKKRFSSSKLTELAASANELGNTDAARRIIDAVRRMKPASNYVKKTAPTSVELEKKGIVKVPVNYRNQGVIIPSITYAFGTGVATENTKVSMFMKYNQKFVIVAKSEADVEKAVKHLATMK